VEKVQIIIGFTWHVYIYSGFSLTYNFNCNITILIKNNLIHNHVYYMHDCILRINLCRKSDYY